MARISIEDCLENIENRFALVTIASHRTRQLMNGKTPFLKTKNKEAVTALREIAEGFIEGQQGYSKQNSMRGPTSSATAGIVGTAGVNTEAAAPSAAAPSAAAPSAAAPSAAEAVVAPVAEASAPEATAPEATTAPEAQEATEATAPEATAPEATEPTKELGSDVTPLVTSTPSE